MSRKGRKDIDIASAPHLVRQFLVHLHAYYGVEPSAGIRELARKVIVAGNGEGAWKVDASRGDMWAINFTKGGKAHVFTEQEGLAIPLCQAYLDGEIAKGSDDAKI